MKSFIFTLLMSSYAMAAQISALSAEAPQLRIESRLDMAQGTTELIFVDGKMSAGRDFTPTCNAQENTCALAVADLTHARDRYLDVNSLLTLQSIHASCSNGKGFTAVVETLRNKMNLRCNLNSIEDLKNVLGKFLTLQFPAKIE